jgi:hypothetical protein
MTSEIQMSKALHYRSKIRGLSLNIPLKVRGIKGVTFITPLTPLILRGVILEKFGEIQMPRLPSPGGQVKCQN